jgi:magnesium transporter
MTTALDREPWEEIEAILQAGDTSRLKAFVEALSPGEIARAVSRLREEDQTRLLTLLPPVDAAALLEELSHTQAADLIDDLPPPQAAAIVNEMPSDEQVDLLGELPAEEAEAIVQEMDVEAAEDVRQLRQFPPDTAGGLMITEYLAYPDHFKVVNVLDDLREHTERYSQYNVQYVYVTSQSDVLVGVLRARDLLLSPPETPVAQIMVSEPLHVQTGSTLDELVQFFDRHGFFGAPVTDEQGQLAGVVRRADVEEAVGDQANRTLLKFSGIVGGEELRTMPLPVRAFRRLSWLSINIVLNVIAASVIALYQDTLAAVIALAVFLPIISDMSGCSGNQAVAVSLRELTLGLVKPYELFRVLMKEAGVGVVNGLLLGMLLGGVAWGWKGNPYLGLVVGGALAINTLVAVGLGGMIPLLLRRRKMDPALASGPILTTVTDMCGFFLALSFATALLPRLAS